jgi:glycosyltransferase involved in cell wall biosynthesis
MRSTKYGGLERHLVALAAACAARGWPMVVQYNQVPRSSSFLRDLREAGAGVVIVRLGHSRLLAALRTIVLIVRLRPKVVHLHFCGPVTRLVVSVLARPLDVGLTVVTVHSMPNPRSRMLARISYARVDDILCVSRAVMERLARMGVRRSAMTTCYLGVASLQSLSAMTRGEVRGRLGIPAEAIVLVSVVFNNPMKGVDVLVDAFVDHLEAAFPGLHLIVIGVDEADAVSASRRADCRSDHMHWMGIQDDVRPYLAAADVYVQPSRTEGLGLAILEAMRDSLAVVATDVGGVPEIVADGESGVLVRPDSASELARAIGVLVADHALRRRFADAGRERWRNHFQASTAIDMVLAQYGRVLS